MESLGQQALELLSELVAIDSVNPALVPGAAGEGEIVAALRARLERAGFEVSVVPSVGSDDRPNLVAAAPAVGARPTVVLNGHLDTVGVSGMLEPFMPRVEGDRLYGRGAADMKGGVAAMVVAAEHLVATGAPVRPVLVLVADEEDASIGSEAVIGILGGLAIRPDVCLIAEPTDLALCRSLRGFGLVRVEFTGRAAHSSQPDRGINAVTHLGRLLHAVDERATVLHAAGADLMATIVEGGTSPFVVPDRAECVIELRTRPDAGGASALDEVLALLQPDWRARAELFAARDGWQMATSGPSAALALRLGDALGTAVTFDAPYWMEAPLWEQVCPTLICGPAGGGMHAIDEWVDLRQVRAFTAALVTALAGWTLDGD